MKNKFYLEMLCRSKTDKYNEFAYYRKMKMSLGRPDCQHIYIPLVYAWQEDPNDLHIQIDPQENLIPRQHKGTGDYIIPATDWLLKHLRKKFEPAIIRDYDFGTIKLDGVLVYHFAWVPRVETYDGGVLAPKSYLKALTQAWEF